VNIYVFTASNTHFVLFSSYVIIDTELTEYFFKFLHSSLDSVDCCYGQQMQNDLLEI